MFSAETTKASVSIPKRPPADEVTPSSKMKDGDEGTSPEGIIH